MSELNRAGQQNSLGHIDTTQGDFRSQIDALTDTVRQLGGKPYVGPGNGSDPLTAPFILYVNSYTGSDKFVSGDYNSTDDGTFESKMRRISLQRLECGYTEARPFKSLSRAVIEAGIITSRDYLNLNPAPCGDLVSIVVAAGLHIADNAPGEATTPAWNGSKEPTADELRAFNPVEGGIILPRGCSVISLDLRKTVIRPAYVPAPSNEQSDGANRRAIFKLTGGCYMFGVTFMDKVDSTDSHHLLDTFHFASERELDRFYAKIRSSFGPAAGVSDSYAQARSTEYTIVGPAPELPTTASDTVRSASPYIYNMSIRSTLGLCGIFADGSKVSGFKSIVVAQYTAISLQNDYTCWQQYKGGAWTSIGSGSEFLSVSQDNIRVNPLKRHYHIRAIKSAVIQEVSVFCIGQAVHHQVESGAQLTITNSNSNFGGCSALANGFQNASAPPDTGWTLQRIQRSLNPLVKRSNIKRIFLGTLTSGQGNTSKTLNLAVPLEESDTKPGQPKLLAVDGYTLKENDYVWVENPGGPDYRARLAATPWTESSPRQIQVKDSLTAPDEDGNETNPGDADLPNIFLPLAGKRVYVRRFVDTRSVDERRYSIIAEDVGSNNLRLPVRDYVIQRVGQASYSQTSIQAVAASQRSNVTDDGIDGVKVELRYSARAQGVAAHKTNVYYRKADVVIKDNKHYTATRESYGTFDLNNWDEAYVHMEQSYNPEGSALNAKPTIIFDKDTDSNENSITLGNALSDAMVQAQLTSAVDYQGIYYYLQNVGVADVSGLLTPQDTQALRYADAPNEPIEFRRPSNIRLYSHAFEWAGFGSYSKALPQYQGEMSANNRFTYYFTASDGGKCYVSGFNEEGLQVSNRGLEDLTTGTVLSVSDIGNPDREIEIPTIFPKLEITEQLILGNGANLIGFPDATTEVDGLSQIASIEDIDNAKIERTDEKLNEAGANFINTAGLSYWANSKNVVTAPTEGIAIKTIHVIPDGTTPLTGINSVPYGYSDERGAGTRYLAGVSSEAKTLTEAMELAAGIYVPTGASILVSVHGDITSVEKGPLQLVNSYANVIVAGARGAASPVVRVESDVTARATARIPQYASVNALSAGITFADLTIKIDANNKRTFLCFNGGIGIGGRDTVIEWENAEECIVCTNPYGGTATIYYYNSELVNRNFTNVLKSTAGSGDFTLELFGSDGGLAGHGTNLILDFLQAGTGAPGREGFTYKFVNEVAAQPCKLSFIAQGGRGGVRSGGRILPIVDLDFSNDNFDLRGWVESDFASNQNYFGVTFQLRKYLAGSSPAAAFNISNESYATITPKTLTNGCCIDIGSEDADYAGPFGLYLQIDEYNGSTSYDDLMLRSRNDLNAFIYGGTAERNGRNRP